MKKLIKENYMLLIYALSLLILLIPYSLSLSKLTGNTTYNITEKLVFICGFAGIIYFFIYLVLSFFVKKIKIKELIKDNLIILLLFILVLWIFTSSFFQEHVSVAIWGNMFNYVGTIHYLCYFGIAFLLSRLLNRQYIKIFILVFFITATLTSFLSFLELYNVNIPLFYQGYDKNFYHCKYVAFFNQFNHYAYYLVMTIAINLGLYYHEKNRNLKMLYFITLFLNLIVSLLNDTFGSSIAIIVIMVISSIYYKCKGEKAFYAFLPLLLYFISATILSLGNFSNLYLDIINLFHDSNNIIEGSESAGESGTGRWQLWVVGFEIFKENNMLIGVGWDSLYEHYMEKGFFAIRPHNELMEYCFFTGLPALFFYISFLLMIFITFIKRMKENDDLINTIFLLIAGYVVSSMFGCTMYYTSPFFFAFVGLFVASINLKKEEEKEKINADI